MKKILALLLFACTSVACMAEPRDPVSHSSSTLGGQARYEMLQSSLAARWTFRLDRVCGNVSQVVVAKSENMTFESMFVMGLPKCVPDGKIRKESSGTADNNTGAG